MPFSVSKKQRKTKHKKGLRKTTKTVKGVKRHLSLEEVGPCHPKVGIKVKGQCLPLSVKRGLLQNESGCKPDDEHCLIDKSSISEPEKKVLRSQYLRPKYPTEWLQKPDTWLDNIQIADVMKQYEEAFPWFRFMGALPIDFSAPDPYLTDKTVKQCMHPEICKLDLRHEHEKGIRGLGFIFNLDPHFKGGSHWVGLYIDLKDIEHPFVGYSDSYGMKPPALIARLMRFIRLQTPNATLGYNARKFQNSNTECGMYSMYFIICMIAGIPFQQYVKEVVPDRFMLDLRKVLFT
jgi:hypothetical protein